MLALIKTQLAFAPCIDKLGKADVDTISMMVVVILHTILFYLHLAIHV